MDNNEKSNALVPKASCCNALVPKVSRDVDLKSPLLEDDRLVPDDIKYPVTSITATGNITFTKDKNDEYVAYLDPTKRCVTTRQSIYSQQRLSSVSSKARNVAREIMYAIDNSYSKRLCATVVLSSGVKVLKIESVAVVKRGGKKVVKLFISTNDLYGSDNYTQEVVGEIDSVDNKNKKITARFFTQPNATFFMQPFNPPINNPFLPQNPFLIDRFIYETITSRIPRSSNRIITRRDRNWWQASPLDEDPIGQRVWISTPDATIDGVSIGSWNEETRTLNVLLSTRGDYIGARTIFVNSIAEIPENFRPGQNIEFWNCSGNLCLRQCDPPGQYGNRTCPGPQIEWIRARGVPYA